MGSSKICTAYSQHYQGWTVNTGMDKYSQKWRIPAFIYISLISLQIILLTVLATHYIVHGHLSTILQHMHSGC